MKIVLCGDNHCNKRVLDDIVSAHPDADYYWHLGDSEFFDEEDLKPFISVKGNNDYGINLPFRREIEVGGHKFLLIHGTGMFPGDYSSLARTAKEKGCDVVLFGHTHRPYDEMTDGIRMINPGSCRHNRGYAYPTYVILDIDEKGKINATFIDIDNDR